ncbi:MAG: glycosyltransferase family protein [Myxococcota bacterium]
MRILYGVVGEGMGHATRSRVVIERLLDRGHAVHVVVSGRAHRFLTEAFSGRERFTIDEIHGLHLIYKGNQVLLTRSLVSNLTKAPRGLLKNLAKYRALAESGFVPELVFSDYESWAYMYALNHRIPVISLDNQQIIDRCSHRKELCKPSGYLSGRTAVKIKLPGAYHYVVTSFFFPPVRRRRTTLVPLILRQEILDAKREPGRHVLVYQTQTTNQDLLQGLKSLSDIEFRVYGLRRDEQIGNVVLKDFSQTGFIDDLRTARAVIAGGGFTLMGEAVHLGVPMHSIPVERQFEQNLNAQYLEELGYGTWSPGLDLERIADFITHTDEYSHNLASYPRPNNEMTFGVIDELVRLAELGEPAPDALSVPSMGRYEPPDWIDEHLLDELEVRDPVRQY